VAYELSFTITLSGVILTLLVTILLVIRSGLEIKNPDMPPSDELRYWASLSLFLAVLLVTNYSDHFSRLESPGLQEVVITLDREKSECSTDCVVQGTATQAFFSPSSYHVETEIGSVYVLRDHIDTFDNSAYMKKLGENPYLKMKD